MSRRTRSKRFEQSSSSSSGSRKYNNKRGIQRKSTPAKSGSHLLSLKSLHRFRSLNHLRDGSETKQNEPTDNIENSPAKSLQQEEERPQRQTRRTRTRRSSSESSDDYPHMNMSRAQDRADTLDQRIRMCLKAAGTFRHQMGLRKRPPISAQVFYYLSDAAEHIQNSVLEFFQRTTESECLERLSGRIAMKMFDLNGSHQIIVDNAMNPTNDPDKRQFRINSRDSSIELSPSEEVRKVRRFRSQTEAPPTDSQKEYADYFIETKSIPFNIKYFPIPEHYRRKKSHTKQTKATPKPASKTTTTKTTILKTITKTTTTKKRFLNKESPQSHSKSPDDDDEIFPPAFRALKVKSVKSLKNFVIGRKTSDENLDSLISKTSSTSSDLKKGSTLLLTDSQTPTKSNTDVVSSHQSKQSKSRPKIPSVAEPPKLKKFFAKKLSPFQISKNQRNSPAGPKSGRCHVRKNRSETPKKTDKTFPLMLVKSVTGTTDVIIRNSPEKNDLEKLKQKSIEKP